MVKYKTDFDKLVVTGNFERRSWVQVDAADDDWNVYWASVGSIKSIFSSETSVRLHRGQLINHFPNHYELTRKDLMVKNIKRYQKQMRKEGKAADALDIVPTTFVLPQDYALFVEDFRKNPNTTWIMKPTARSQGKGIFLINKLSQVKKWSNGLIASFAARTQLDSSYVVSRYIENPLLVGGKKFDLRLYVVVVSYKPLVVYMSDLGFGRFCNVKYTTEVAEIDNVFVHLTNVAIQKHGDDYNAEHGNKWSYGDMILWVEGVHGSGTARQLVADIESLIVNSLKACQSVIINDKHCFELYGYDVMIDADFKPWLIEVRQLPAGSQQPLLRSPLRHTYHQTHPIAVQHQSVHHFSP
jgi:tubulin polyglutamylase TTLL1